MASIAAPPMRPSFASKGRQASSTRRAAFVTSGPMPSPGRTAIFGFMRTSRARGPPVPRRRRSPAPAKEGMRARRARSAGSSARTAPGGTPPAGCRTTARPASTSIETSTPGASTRCRWVASSTWTGRRPFLSAFPRKMSAKAVLTTASRPPAWSAHTACSREEPQPKLRPATRTRAPSASGRFRANPGFGAPVLLPPPVGEERPAEALARRGDEKAGRDDLVGVHVLGGKDDGAGADLADGFHRGLPVIPRDSDRTGPEGSAGTADPSSPDSNGAPRDDRPTASDITTAAPGRRRPLRRRPTRRRSAGSPGTCGLPAPAGPRSCGCSC